MAWHRFLDIGLGSRLDEDKAGLFSTVGWMEMDNENLGSDSISVPISLTTTLYLVTL